MTRLLPTDRRLRILSLIGYAIVALVALLLLVVALFPIGALKPLVERGLTARFGRPVTIGAIERREWLSLTPTIVVRWVRVPQPRWAGRGDFAKVAMAEIRLPLLPLLRGQITPRAITLTGARVTLVRTKDGRENWTNGRDTPANDDAPALDHLRIADSVVSYRDAQQDRAFVVALTADGAGVRATGRGSVRGSPVTVAFEGAPVGRANDTGWPFQVAIDGADLSMNAQGTMRAPFDMRHMIFDTAARATDLKFVDAIIEAGLFRTQPVRLSAHVVRNADTWRVTKMVGTVGRSTLSAHLTIAKRAGRTKIDGAVTSSLFDPTDLSSNEAIAAGNAKERAIGLRIVPETRIDIAKIRTTDITLDVRIARILRDGQGTRLSNARATVGLVDRIATIAPLRIGLPQGAITGRIVIDQRGGPPEPKLTVDLRLSGSTIESIAGGGGSVTGRLDGRARLTGRGATVRAAIAGSSGRIGIAARDGTLPERIADTLGFDAGRALLAGDTARAGLRCVIVGLNVRGGTGRTDPMVLDTTQSSMRGDGTVSFPSEAVSIRLSGAPKRGSVLRLPGSITMAGTIREPEIVVPREVKSVGNIFKAIGRAITGNQGPVATDADCAGLAARVLR